MLKTSFKFMLGLVLLAGLRGEEGRAVDDLPQPYVVLVGIDQYNDPQIKPRKFAEADAKALYDLFVDKNHLGVTPNRIKLLLGKVDAARPSELATKENILKAIQWIEKSAGKDDMVIFAFIGEGAPLGERSCFFGVDSTFKNRAKDAVAAADIQQHLDNMKSQRFLTFIDCNFLGFDAGKDKTPDVSLGNYYREFLGPDDARDGTVNRVVMLANTGTKPSLDLDKHGIFTQVLLNGLRGEADIEGYEADGNITAGELIKYVEKKLPALAREHGKTDVEKAQIPPVLADPNSNFIINLNPKVAAQSRERLAKFDRFAKDNNLPKDIAEEGHTLLARMPKLKAKQDLRKAYQNLADGKTNLAGFNTERKDILATTLLAEREANTYALLVMRAVGVASREYFKDLNRGELVENSIRGIFRRAHEKLPSSIGDRFDGIKSAKEADLLKLLADARTYLGLREDLANGKDVTFSLQGMLSKLDQHTDYIDPETADRWNRDVSGNFKGIGVLIRHNNVKDMLQVVTPIIGSPAYKAKMQANDIITTIIREEDSFGTPLPKPEVISTKGMTTDQAVKLITGQEGTKVKLIVEREGEKEPLVFNLTRSRVEVESVLGFKRNEDDSWNYVIDSENKICYVRLTQFSRNTARDLENLMRKLSKSGIKGFILDLRFNPGGLLDSSVKISDLFIEDGLIVSIRPRNAPETSYVGKADGSYVAFPMVCLINGESASASEIVSACLQDHRRAVIVGSRSFGKGSVQTMHQFFETRIFSPDKMTPGILKLTTATFWRPNGKNLNKASTKGAEEDEWGVTPNPGFSLKLGTKELGDLKDHLRDSEIIRGPNGKPDPSRVDFRDRQLDMALEYLRNQIRIANKANLRKAG